MRRRASVWGSQAETRWKFGVNASRHDSANCVERFLAKLQPVSHGGHYVVVPNEVAESAGLKYGMRVHGTVNGIAYRSSLMKCRGIFHLGIHKATLARAGVTRENLVDVTIEVDNQPLPTDRVPRDLMQALTQQPGAREAWTRLAPSRRREFVEHVLGAKKDETRARRIAKVVATLAVGARDAAVAASATRT